MRLSDLQLTSMVQLSLCRCREVDTVLPKYSLTCCPQTEVVTSYGFRDCDAASPLQEIHV